MCLPALTRRYRLLRYLVSECVLAMGFLYLASGFLMAQSQDYINATNAAEIAHLKRQIENLDSRMWYVLVGVASSLLAQILNIRQTFKNGREK